MCIDKNFGNVFINDTFDASYSELHLSHLNLFDPSSFYNLLYCWIQLFSETFGSGKNKLKSMSSTYDSVTKIMSELPFLHPWHCIRVILFDIKTP
jgi:hypothetical protein